MWYRITLIIALLGMGWGQDASEQGKNLFNQRCAACHKLEQKLIGPPLARISERRTEEWFVKFVSNSQAFIQSGDPQAVAIYKEYNQQIMPPFTDLSEADIKAIWTYLNSIAAPQTAQAASSAGTVTAAASESKTFLYPGEARPMKPEEFSFMRTLYWILAGVAVLVALVLGVVIHLVSLKQASQDSNP